MFDETKDATQTDAVSGRASQAALSDMLRVSRLKLLYGDVAAIEDIDLDVGAQEFVVLLGPSGCGKTSLLRSIAGFNTPQEGQIVLNGQDVAKLRPRDRNIGIVFQDYALFPHMTALQNVAFGLECRHLPKSDVRKRALAALEKVRLGDFADRRPKAMSGGQQQRIALARAIAIEPKLLLLDEPLGALDKKLRMQMQSELKELQRSLGITAIFVTHDQEEAIAMADRIVVMRNGRIQQVATPTALFAHPATAWVADFINAGNLVSGEIEESNGRWSVRLPGDVVLSAPKPEGTPRSGAKLLVREHKLKVTPSDGPSPYSIAALQPNGMMITARIRWSDGILCAQLPIDGTNDLSVGTPVRLSTGSDAGTWLAGD